MACGSSQERVSHMLPGENKHRSFLGSSVHIGVPLPCSPLSRPPVTMSGALTKPWEEPLLEPWAASPLDDADASRKPFQC